MATPKRLQIGTKIIIVDGQSTGVELTIGKETIILEPGTLKRLGENFANIASVAMAIDAYRLMLITRGEPNATEHAQDYMNFLEGLANVKPQADSPN